MVRHCFSIFFASLLLLSSVKVFAQENASPFNAELSEVLTIGDDESAPREYLFGRIVGVRTDADGNIYVADQKTMNVRVFGPGGDYLRTIGTRGRGPGEFSHITSMHVDRQNRLVVADNMNSRFTWFAPDGEVIDTRIYNNSELQWPRQIGQVSSGKYLLLYRSMRGTDLFHVIPSAPGGERLQSPLTSFGPLSMFPSSDEPFARQSAALRPGQFWQAGSNTFVFAPGLYDGRLFEYQRADSGWRAVDTLSGWLPERGAFTPLDDPSGDDHATTFHSGGQDIPGVIHTISAGVFVTDTGHIAHFLVSQGEDSAEFGVQVFDSAGQFLGFDVLERLDERIGTVPTREMAMLWIDDRGRFYLKDRREAPALRVFKLNYSVGE